MNRKRLVIGLTGGIATGKSSVLAEWARHGVKTLSSDDLAHQALRRGTPCYRRIVRYFGPGILAADRTIDRRALGRLVFQDSSSRKWLERQIHPFVVRELRQFSARHRGWIALDIPLLYEAHLEKLVDWVVVVSSPQQAQVARLSQRNGLARAEALHRIRAQWPIAEKIRRADYALSNRGDLATLKKKARDLLHRLQLQENA